MISTRVRTAARLAVAGLFLVLVGSGTAGLADTPAGWEDAPSESLLAYVLVLFLIPAGLFIVIFTLASLPGLMGKDKPSAAVEARQSSDLSA